MEIAKLDWHSFISRRRLDVKAWLKHHNIRSYKALVEKCESMNMEPPNKNQVTGLFGIKKVEKPKVVEIKKEIVEEIAIEKAKVETPKPSKKRGRKSKVVDKPDEDA